jgi:hypothetical protein
MGLAENDDMIQALAADGTHTHQHGLIPPMVTSIRSAMTSSSRAMRSNLGVDEKDLEHGVGFLDGSEARLTILLCGLQKPPPSLAATFSAERHINCGAT